MNYRFKKQGQAVLITSEKGEVRLVPSVNQWCNQKGISRTGIRRALSGEIPEYHGWKVEPLTARTDAELAKRRGRFTPQLIGELYRDNWTATHIAEYFGLELGYIRKFINKHKLRKTGYRKSVESRVNISMPNTASD